MRNDYGVTFSAIVFCVGIFVLTIWASWYEDSQWQDFSKAHNCQLVAKNKGTVIVTTSGHFGVSEDTKSYKCDDGITYTR